MYFNRLYCVHICIFSTVGWSDYCMVLENFDFNSKIGKKKNKMCSLACIATLRIRVLQQFGTT